MKRWPRVLPSKYTTAWLRLAIMPSRHCLRIGAFQKVQALRARASAFDDASVVVTERVWSRRAGATGLFLQGSKDKAIRLVRILRAAMIDSFVITDGPLANGISLGLFSKKPERPKGSDCKSDAKASLVRIQPPPPEFLMSLLLKLRKLGNGWHACNGSLSAGIVQW